MDAIAECKFVCTCVCDGCIDKWLASYWKRGRHVGWWMNGRWWKPLYNGS